MTLIVSLIGNTIFEPGKEGSSEKGSGSGSGDKVEDGVAPGGKKASSTETKEAESETKI